MFLPLSRRRVVDELKLHRDNQARTSGCVPPDSVVGKDTSVIASMFGSHDWVVSDSKPFGNGGVLIYMRCSRCDADGMATILRK